MEFKNCEQYVVAELEEHKEIVARQKEQISFLEKRIEGLSDRLTRLQDLIYDVAKYNHSESYYDWFSFSIWDNGDSERPEFDGILELVPKLREKISLQLPEKGV